MPQLLEKSATFKGLLHTPLQILFCRGRGRAGRRGWRVVSQAHAIIMRWYVATRYAQELLRLGGEPWLGGPAERGGENSSVENVVQAVEDICTVDASR